MIPSIIRRRPVVHPPSMKAIGGMLLLCLLTMLVAPGAVAQAPSSQSNEEMLRQLDQLAGTCRGKLQTRRLFAQSEAQAASLSGTAAVSMYLKALQGTRYAGNPQGFEEWRRKNEAIITSSPFQAAAMLQLQYLVLALKSGPNNDVYAQVPQYFAYLNALAQAQPSWGSGGKARRGASVRPGGGKPEQEALALISQPIGKSAVVEWLQVGDLLPSSDFEPVPGNQEGIMEKNVRGPLRARKDPRLIATWDEQITMESAEQLWFLARGEL